MKDRQQKIDQINQRGRVAKVSDVEIHPTIVHPDYRSEPCDGVLSETGKLEVLKVAPKSGHGPYFIARWDQKPEHLDIDMFGTTKNAIKLFKAAKGGYSGHHTRQSADLNERRFHIRIEIPTGTIFDGIVKFFNAYVLPASALNMTIESNVTVQTRVTRAASKSDTE
ncbi:MAG: hypothetical protein J0H42_10375 [Rhizobiales bacterium]|nr:hypothetical protein [Hyphomicrobiales bacterium]